MNIGWMAAGIVGAAALGTLLYRSYKQEQQLSEGRASRIERTASAALRPDQSQAHGTMPPDRRPPAPTITKRLPMGTSMSINENEAARPSRISRMFLLIPPTILVGLVILALLLRGDYRIATTLGLVQGLGEFLPISSSAHLIITPWLFGWTDADAFYNTQWYDVTLHIGTLLALIGFFWRDWISLIRHAPQPQSEDGRLFWMIVLASLPGAVIGFMLDRFAADFFRDKYLVIAAALGVMGVALYYSDKRGAQQDEIHQISWSKALSIGMAQALAFVPGVSRSGSTMTMGRALGLKRETAARFSFLMSMPITCGAALLKLKDIEPAAMSTVPFWLGIGVSFLVGVLAIGFLLRYLKTNSFLPFVLYRLVLAAVIVVVYVQRG